jgi:putative spermidine/putrescine transport system substrate-binding protein
LFTKRHFAGIAVITAAAITLAGCAGTETPAADFDAATATNAEAFGGLDALIAAAQAEGELNVIALPDNWANYGEVKALFEEKYGIIVNSADPDISSAEEIAAADNLRGQDTPPTSSTSEQQSLSRASTTLRRTRSRTGLRSLTPTKRPLGSG